MFKKIVKKLDTYKDNHFDQAVDQLKEARLKEDVISNPYLKMLLKVASFLIVPMIYLRAIDNFLYSPIRKIFPKRPNN